MHNGPCLTDVGCSYKMLRKDAFRSIQDRLGVGGSHFSAELMLVAIRSGLRCVEIPVHYQARAGTSKITGSMLRAIRVGLRMIWLTVWRRFRSVPRVAADGRS